MALLAEMSQRSCHLWRDRRVVVWSIRLLLDLLEVLQNSTGSHPGRALAHLDFWLYLGLGSRCAAEI